MTPQSAGGQDASVAVLQVQIQNQQQTMLDLARTVNEGMATLSTKVDRLSEVASTIATISERMASHSDGLQRAFNQNQALHDRLTEHLEESGTWRATLNDSIDKKFAERDKALGETKNTIGTWRGIVIGFMGAAGLVAGMATFLAGKYVEATEKNEQDIHELETKVNGLPYAYPERTP